MTRRLLVAVSPGELWAVVADNGAVEALRLARTGGAPRRGDLYLGRVVALRPEMPAALVDIGAARPALLDTDAMPLEGEALIVKVLRPARAEKAAVVTAKLTSEDSAHVRAGSETAPPTLLHRRETVLASLLDAFAAPPLDEIVIDDDAALAEARLWLNRHRPELAGAVTPHRDREGLFECQGVTGEIERALAPRVALPGGGAITIETSLAATLIDVDGGRAAALPANLAAAGEIARQIRLRDLAGPIVVDFIGMAGRAARARLETALAAAFTATDEAQLLGWTRLGHFELVRPRRRASLAELLFEHRPGGGQIKTPLTVALEALRQLQREHRQAPGKRYRLRVNAEIAASFVGEAREPWREFEARFGPGVAIVAEARPRESFAIEPL
jgi:Ribonuclease G/E